MPIYEYECPQCGRFEIMQRISATALTECPNCAERGIANKVNRLISPTTFVLKGSGWYKTDYRSNGSSPKAGEEQSGSGSDGKAGDASKKEAAKESSTEASTAGTASKGSAAAD